MLEIGKDYLLPDGRNLTVIDRLDDDQGVTALVFKVKVFAPEDGKTQVLAAKEPRAARNVPELRHEEKVINKILRAYTTDKRPPVPCYAEFVETITSNSNGTTTSALLMEFIEGQPLSRVYSEMTQLPANAHVDSLSHALEGERMAWRAAKQYLAFLRRLLNQVRLVSTDRKYDTFRWQYDSNVLDGQLLIIDWNQSKEITDHTSVEAYNAVRLLVQNWYILFTKRDPINIPPRLAEERWEYLSLGGRDLLLNIFNQPSYYFSLPSADSVLSDVEGKLDHLLRLIEDEAYLDTHISKGDEVAADIGRRRQWPKRDAARLQYEAWLKTQQTIYIDQAASRADLVNTLPNLPSNADTVQFVRRLHQNIENFRNKYQPELKKDFVFKNSLDLLVDAIDETLHQLNLTGYDSKTADDLKTRVEKFKQTASLYITAFKFGEQFAELDNFARMYVAWTDINQALRNGVTDFDDLRGRMESIKAYLSDAPPGLASLLNLTPEAVQTLYDRLKQQSRLPDDLYQQFIDACRNSTTEDFRRYLKALLTAAPTRGFAHVVRLYQEALDKADKFTYYQPYTRTQMFEGLHELGLFIEQFPELSPWAKQLNFVRNASHIYKSEQAKKTYNPALLLLMAGLLKKLDAGIGRR